ncbi:transposable element Tcb2 transposase [Trichonephila clavipes]|nr:transposable element Tcb2 transposase [Trichonephila clavipes]
MSTVNCFIGRLPGPGRPSLGVPVSSRTIRRRLAEGHLGSRRPLRVLPLTPINRRLRLECYHARGNWTTAELNQVVFSDESNLSSDDNRVRVWRPRGERLNPAFDLQRHTAPTTGVVVWVTLKYMVTPSIDSWHHDCPEHIWDHLGWRVGHPTSLKELEARLQQIWNEMSQDIIQNLYASMPDRIASRIRARGGSTGVFLLRRVAQKQTMKAQIPKEQQVLGIRLSIFLSARVEPGLPYVSERWFEEFRRGHNSLQYEEHTGRPQSAVIPDKVSTIRKMLKDNNRCTYQMIQKELNIKSTAIHEIIREELHMKKVVCR